MRRALAAFVLASTLLAALLVARAAGAHPAGLASVNRYIGVVCEDGGRVRIAYVLDFAEMPSIAELDRLDPNQDGSSTPEEQSAYLAERLPPLVSRWAVDVDGVPATTRVVTSKVDVRPGQQGLQIVRITAEIAVETSAAARAAGALVHVHVHDDVLADRLGWREMEAGDTREAVVVDGPEGDPSRALDYGSGRPVPRVDDATFTFRVAKGASAARPMEPPAWLPPIDGRLVRLAQTMKRASGSWSFSALALLMAFGFGAAHALSPGHGKTLAAAYLVGRRARLRQALVFGATVAVAHTVVVFLMGSFAVMIERSVGSDRLMRGVELASALAVLVLGGVQLSRRWREVATGHADHADHAGHEHTPRTRAESVTALGAAAGVTPCPSALVLLLSAGALHRYAFGLLLVGAFSLGVAATLTTVGALVVAARGWADRAPRARPVVRWLPVLSSAAVLVVGVLLCAGALS